MSISKSNRLPNQNLQTETELFALISEGSEDAFRELYKRWHPILRGYIIKILHTEEDMMEILQESLLRLWLNRDKLAGIQYPRTWFIKIVTNECYRYFRKHGLQHRLLSALENVKSDEIAHNTEQELAFRETQRFIQQAVRTLPPRQREIYILSRDKGLRIPEIAEQLGVTPKYVTKTLGIALQVIRQKLTQAGKFMLSFLLWFFS